MFIGMIEAEETAWEGTKWGGMHVRVVKQHDWATGCSYRPAAFGKKNDASKARPGRGGTGTFGQIASGQAGECDLYPRRRKGGPSRQQLGGIERRHLEAESRM